MLQKFNAKLSTYLLAAFALMIASPAFAGGGIDVTAVTTAIDSAKTPIATIGAAVLVVLVGVKVYKWIRRAL